MSSHHQKSLDEIVATTHNTSRYFTENPHIAWVLLAGTLLWGYFAYEAMPKRKDPEVPVIAAAAVCPWPGASAERIEQLVARRMEERIAENARVTRIESISRGSVAIVLIGLDERTKADRTGIEFDDIAMRLNSIRDLPQGAGPIQFIKDFGDTAALMLTVASPKADGVGLALRARGIRAAIERVRAEAGGTDRRVTLVASYPLSIVSRAPARQRDLVARLLSTGGYGRDLRTIDGSGFVGVDMVLVRDERETLAFLRQSLAERLVSADFHPDIWPPVIVDDPATTEARLASVAGDKYSYRELDEFTELIKRVLQGVPQVAKVTRAGLLPEQVFIDYSQERMASLGLRPSSFVEVLAARNITMAAGLLDVQGKSVTIDPSGEFRSEQEIGNVIVGASNQGRAVYLRDVAVINRGYQTPARFLNYYSWKDAQGALLRSRAITLAIQMKPGEQIGQFGVDVDAALEALRPRLPADLILARPSDQPLQVEENIDLFMKSLYEAIGLVIIVALVGFWEWRSAMLMAVAIPLTLAMTFGFMRLLNVDVQQVSIASLIIALGLLVDDPVVAGDAIKRELDAGVPRGIAAWLGPTRLATAILFATITNIVAYLPMLLLTGSIGHFIYSLPIVLACSLVASRIVSMTFIPMLGEYLLRPAKRKEPPIAERRTRGFSGWYYRVGGWAIDHRWAALGIAVACLAASGVAASSLKVQFFPKDLSYLSYVELWLPEDSTLAATNQSAQVAERVIRDVAAEYGKEHPGEDGKPRTVLASVTSFVGGGGPRFWFSVAPELFQPNYAQLIINVHDKHDTAHLIAPLQRALAETVPGARVDVRQLETGKPVGIPVAVRIAGEDIGELRRLAEEAKAIFRKVAAADRVRDDWGADSFKVKLQIDPERANFAQVSNLDVAMSSVASLNGLQVTSLRQGTSSCPSSRACASRSARA